jgi:hypothetical protein
VHGRWSLFPPALNHAVPPRSAPKLGLVLVVAIALNCSVDFLSTFPCGRAVMFISVHRFLLLGVTRRSHLLLGLISEVCYRSFNYYFLKLCLICGPHINIDRDECHHKGSRVGAGWGY